MIALANFDELPTTDNMNLIKLIRQLSLLSPPREIDDEEPSAYTHDRIHDDCNTRPR